MSFKWYEIERKCSPYENENAIDLMNVWDDDDCLVDVYSA